MAEAVLNLPDGPFFIKYVRANKSTLECVYSQLRSVHRDTADKIAKELAGIEVKSNVDKITGMVGRYHTDHIGDETGANRIASVLCRTDESRAMALKLWMEPGNRSGRKCSGSVNVLPANFAVEEPEATIVQFVLGTEPQNMHFSELLLGDTDFSEIAKVSVGGRTEEFFKAMCLLEGKSDGKFDRVYQEINVELVKIVGSETQKRQKSKRSKSTIPVTMWRHILEYLQSSTFAKLVQSNPGPALKSHAGMDVVVITLTRLFNEKIGIGMVARSKRLQGAPQKQVMVDPKREVNSSLGWAIIQVYDVYRDTSAVT
jgi:hypothetical protein